jgi:hypothetical protein
MPNVNPPSFNHSATGFQYLTEDAIKRAAVKYLKGYYRFRERSGETTTGLDMVTENGAKADGLLTYPDGVGKPFRATIEATSFETRYEVLYVNQTRKLFIDAFTAALVGASVLFLSAWWSRLLIIAQIGMPKTVLFILCLLCLIYVIFHIFWQNESRYRYIPALEQFKSYHADEQWVAIGEDVFYAPNDNYLVELKKQCIYNGFGLIVVSDRLEPQPWLTPAREEVFQKRRQEQGFYKNNNSAFQKLTTNKTVQAINAQLRKRLPAFNFDFRFFSTISEKINAFSMPQLALAAAMTLLVGSLLYREYEKQTSVEYVSDEAKYAEERLQEKLKRDDHSAAQYGQDPAENEGASRKYKTKDVPKSYDTGNNNGIFANSDELVAKTPYGASGSNTQNNADMYVNSGYNTTVKYSCERLAHLKGKYYVVMESGWNATADAIERVDELKKLGVSEASYLWLGCFDATKKNYIVYIGGIDKDKKSADLLATRFSAWLDKKGESTVVQVVTIEKRKK